MRDDVYSKIERADQHIHELHAVIGAFTEGNPYGIGSKHDSETGAYLVYLESARALPGSIPLIVGDVIQNLYSALDYLAWQLVLAAGHQPAMITAFPISEHPPATSQQISRYEGQVRGMKDEVKDLIRGMSPYRGANNSLWRLHKLNNINKHRKLLAVHCNTPSASGWGNALDNMELIPEPLEEGSVFARFPPGTKGHNNVMFSFDVALNEMEADTRMWPILVALGVFRNTVNQTVLVFDDHR